MSAHVSLPVCVLDFDNSVTQQARLLQLFKPRVYNLKEYGPLCRHWVSQKTASALIHSFDKNLRNAITFLGSGDFHHISALLIQQLLQPISVIVFDHHPDWDILPPRLGCGSWVTRILGRENVKKVALLGVSSGDINTASLITANIDAFKDNRLEVYPYTHGPSRCFFRNVPDNKSIQVKRSLFSSQICWQELRHMNPEGLAHDLIARLPTKEVYVSIDKDCLRPEYSLTNWEEGCMALGELLSILKIIKEHTNIVGVDIVGDYSPPRVEGIVKSVISRIDHPRNYSARGKSADLITALNEQTNVSILNLLTG